MLRKRIESLSVEDGTYLLEGKPFSGVGFEPREGRFVNAVMVDKGKISSDHRSPYYPSADRPRQIDISGFTEGDLSGDEGAVLSNGDDLAYDLSRGSYDLVFRGRAYSGLAYEFRRGNCIGEFGYRDGNLVSKARWDAKGDLTGLYLEGETIQDYHWHPSGPLNMAHLYRVTHAGGVARHVFAGRFVFSEKGTLTAMSVDKAFIAFLDGISDLSACSPVRNAEDLGKLTGAELLSLSGDGIDDQVFERMNAGGVFKNTSELRLSKTSLRGRGIGIESLVGNRHLRRLRFESNKELQLEFVNALRSKQLDVVHDSR